MAFELSWREIGCVGEGLYKTGRWAEGTAEAVALRLAGMWVGTCSWRKGGMADMDILGRARVHWMFRARGPYEEVLRDMGSALLGSKEEAEEGSGAIVALWTEPPAQLVFLPLHVCPRECLQGTPPDLCWELAGLHFLQPLSFRNGRTEFWRGDAVCPQWWQIEGPVPLEEDVCMYPEVAPGSKPHF